MNGRFLIFAILGVLGVFLVVNKIHGYRQKKLGFHGIVQKVEYSSNKGTPTIIVNNESYFLSDPIDFKHLIEAGDSISKNNDEEIYRLFKKNDFKVIVFEDR